MTENITSDMYTNISSPYYGIATDCADMTYFSRAIFSMENELPFVLNTYWDGTKERISNSTTRYDKAKELVTHATLRDDHGKTREVLLPKPLNNGKMRTFLRGLGASVGTWSLPQDTYPVAVTKEQMRPGLVYLRQGYNRMTTWEAIRTYLTGTPPNPEKGPGHALLVHDVRSSGAIEFIQSTLPKRVRELTMIYETELLPTNNKLGFRRFVQPDQVGKPFASLVGFSEEQFTEIGRVPVTVNCSGESIPEECYKPQAEKKSDRRDISTFRKDIFKRIATRAESSAEKNERLIKSVCGSIKQRADVIQIAEIQRAKLNGKCMDAQAWDNYSTPSRDEQIRQFIKQVSFNSQATQLFKACGAVDIDGSGKTYDMTTLVESFRRDKFSSNPNETIPVRWGFDRERSGCQEPKIQ